MPNVQEAQMRELLKQLEGLSRAVGTHSDYTQAGGGNTSVKSPDGKLMLIKASGFKLADVTEDAGWVDMDMEKVTAILENPNLDDLSVKAREARVLELLMDARAGTSRARPSVESNLHALLDQFVVHTHPTMITALVTAKNGTAQIPKLAKAIGQEILWIPYVEPGYTLAKIMAQEITKFRDANKGTLPNVILLGNHGLFVSSANYDEALGLTAKVVNATKKLAKGEPSLAPTPKSTELDGSSCTIILRGALYRTHNIRTSVIIETGSLARWLASSTGTQVARIPALTPDEICYCGRLPLILSKKTLTARDPLAAATSEIEKYVKRFGYTPKIVIIPGLGFAALGATPAVAAGGIEAYVSAVRAKLIARRFGGPKSLPPARAQFIEQWEVESFRHTLMGGDGTKPLSGQVAFVTGAASGLGRNLAIGLAKAGAYVACSDIDSEGLESVVEEIGKKRGFAVRTDVTEEDSVENAFHEAIMAFGGLDILVNAAGIAPAHPLVNFPVEAWRKTLEINLTGYFLCAREAARIFVKQGAGGSIVNISSKTGLVASKNNTAYNATKAGELHIARGWALELGEHGIRVNCIAPGNVFKGSKIWNAQYIRECARKRGLKPEEVIPYYIAMTPLKQETEPIDIINGVIFLCAETGRNITGQTLVIDGGQVPVR